MKQSCLTELQRKMLRELTTQNQPEDIISFVDSWLSACYAQGRADEKQHQESLKVDSRFPMTF